MPVEASSERSIRPRAIGPARHRDEQRLAGCRGAAQSLGDAVTIERWQRDIDECRFGREGQRCRDAGEAVEFDMYVEAIQLEQSADAGRRLGMILDEENSSPAVRYCVEVDHC